MPESIATIKLVGKDLATSEIKKAEVAIKVMKREIASAEQIARKFRKTVSTPITNEAAKATASMAEHMKKAESESAKATRTLAGMEEEAKRLTKEFRNLEVGTDKFVNKGRELNAVNQEIQKIKKSTGEIPKSGLADLLGPLAARFSYAAVAAGILAIGSASVQAASNLQELRSAALVTFDQGFAQVEAEAGRIAEEVGRAQSSILGFATDIGSIIKPAGNGAKATQDMSLAIAKLSVDLASFRNTSDQQAFEAIRSGIVGQTEPLRRYGVNLTEANLRVYALNSGIKQKIDTMNQAQLIALRYSYIMSLTRDAQGDAARTAEGFANQSRALKDEVKRLNEELGKDLTPVLAKAIGGLSSLVRTFTNDLINARNAMGQLFAMAGKSDSKAVRGLIGGSLGLLGSRLIRQEAVPFGPELPPGFVPPTAKDANLKDEIDRLAALGTGAGGGGGVSAAEELKKLKTEIEGIERDILQALGEQARANLDRLKETKEELETKRKLGVISAEEERQLERINRRTEFQSEKVRELTEAWKQQTDAIKEAEKKAEDYRQSIEEVNRELQKSIAGVERDAGRSKQDKLVDLIKELREVEKELSDSNLTGDKRLDLEAKRRELEALIDPFRLTSEGQAALAQADATAALNPFQLIDQQAAQKIADLKAEAEQKIKGYQEEIAKIEETKQQLLAAEQEKKNAVLSALQERSGATDSILKVIEDRTTSHVNQQIAEYQRLAAQMKSPAAGASAVAKVTERATGGYASGLTLVGERGPELVSFPAGTYVRNNRETSQVLGNRTVVQGPIIGTIVVKNEADKNQIIATVTRVLELQSQQAA